MALNTSCFQYSTLYGHTNSCFGIVSEEKYLKKFLVLPLYSLKLKACSAELLQHSYSKFEWILSKSSLWRRAGVVLFFHCYFKMVFCYTQVLDKNVDICYVSYISALHDSSIFEWHLYYKTLVRHPRYLFLFCHIVAYRMVSSWFWKRKQITW